MEKYMEKEKNIMIINKLNLKENIYMDSDGMGKYIIIIMIIFLKLKMETEKEKNTMEMVNYHLKENI